MAAFISAETSVATTTPVKVADAESFPRRVFTGDSNGAFRVAFTSADASNGALISKLSASSTTGAVDFPLPAGQELWVYQTSGSTLSIHTLITADGEE